MSTAVVWPNGTRTEPTRSDPYGPRKPIKVPGYVATRPFHVGGDFLLDGETVYAILPGKVVSAGRVAAYSWAGIQVLIDHGIIDGHRYWSRSCHLAKTTVRAGQDVTAGTPLGTEGSTGLVQGRHLHLEVYRDGLSRGEDTDPGDTIDPRTFILSLLTAPASIPNKTIPAPAAPLSEEDEMIPLRTAYFRGTPGTQEDTILVVDVKEHTFYRVASTLQLDFIKQTAGAKVEDISGVQSFDLIRGFREI